MLFDKEQKINRHVKEYERISANPSTTARAVRKGLENSLGGWPQTTSNLATIQAKVKPSYERNCSFAQPSTFLRHDLDN
jgi:hypothetical protein